MLELVVVAVQCSARRRQPARVSRCSRATVGQFWRDSRSVTKRSVTVGCFGSV
jgi:hypothetical protein